MPQLKYIFRIIGHIGRLRAVGLITVILVSNIIESIGLATLLPIFAIASGDTLGDSELASKILGLFTSLGIPTDLTTLCIIVGVTLVSREIIMFLAMTYIGRAIADMAFNYRHRMLSSLLSADWKYFSENQLGNMSVSMTTFTDLAANAVNLSVRTIAVLMRTIAYLILVVLISGYFAAIAFCAGVVSLFLLSGIVKLSKKYGDKQGGLLQDLSVQFTDVFASIKSVKVMNRESQIGKLFSKNIRRLNKTFKNLVILKEGLASLQRIIELLVILTTLFIAVTYWDISIIEMGIIGALMSQIMVNINRAQKMLQKAMQLDVYFWRIDKIINETEAAREFDKGTRKAVLLSSIDFKNISFSFPNKKILDNQTFSIPARKISVIYGPSGQGKTTITDLISRLYQPETGDILVDDVSLNKLNLQKWRELIGYVPQELILLNSTIEDNISFGVAEVTENDILRALEKAGAMEFVSQLPEGIKTIVGEKGMKLSGGQRQRLSIARGLVHDPDILILDEITSALDPKIEQEICEQIAKLNKEKTVIAITHRPAWLKIADQVLQLENAKIKIK